MKKLIQFLNEKPYKIATLAREAGVNPTLLHDALKGRKPLPSAAAWAIIWHLAPVVIDGWTFIRDEQVFALFVERHYEGGQGQESIDHGDHFEYRVSVMRDLLSDSYELSEFLS